MKPLQKVFNILTWVIVIAAVLLAVLLVGVRLFGFTPYAVLSPSMTPKYPVGDLVYTQKVAPEEIRIGDPITFVADENLTVVTHRVVEIDAENGCVYTQGDANETRDGNPVYYENILGRVSFSLPKLGYVSIFMSKKNGKFAAVAVLAALILLLIVPEFFKPAKKKVSTVSEETAADTSDS